MPDGGRVVLWDEVERWVDAVSDAVAAMQRTDAAILRAKAACDAVVAEINAMRSYTNARVELDRITGQTLAKNNVSVEEAYTGSVSKQPDPPPPALLQENEQ